MSTHHPARQLALLAVAELLVMTLWFSATAVLPSLVAAWQLSATSSAWLTASVQLGFVVGALTAALFNLPDVLPPRRMVWVSALCGALANLLLATVVDTVAPALLLRFITGVCLAGVYPPGMKIAAGHVQSRGRGLAIGVLVGALTLGSATPHLIADLMGNIEVSYRAVLVAASVLAIVGATIIVLFVKDGPHAPPSATFDAKQIGRVFRDRPVLLANLGYFGHMWELYAMWAWLAVYLTAIFGADNVASARRVAFLAIGVAGAIGAVFAGYLADRLGRTTVTIVAMLFSGACCLLSAWMFSAPQWLLILFVLLWGTAIVADSAQFSAAVTELVEPETMGTALTLQTSMGFALTLVTIWGLPLLAAEVGWRYALMLLAPGPLLGSVAMLALRRRKEAVRMAGGRR